MADKQNILMLGVGRDQLPAIKEALKLGLGVVGLDGDPAAPGFEHCDQHAVCNIKDPDEVEKVALEWNRKAGVDAVVAPAVEVGPSVGRVVDRLGLRGIGEATAKKLTDKAERCWQLEMAGVAIPKTDHRRFYQQGMIKLPVVIKPRDQSAAVGVKLIENEADLEAEPWDVAQEYLEGWEISTEALVLPNGDFIACHADRNYDKKLKWKPYLLEDGCQLPSKIPERIKKKIMTTTKRIIDYFGIRNAAIKLDLLVKDNVVYVVEVAPRLGGGKLSSVMIPMAYGLNWWGMAVKLACGMPIMMDDLAPLRQPPKFVAQRYHFPENPTSHKSRLGSVEVKGKTYDEAIANAERAIAATRPG